MSTGRFDRATLSPRDNKSAAPTTAPPNPPNNASYLDYSELVYDDVGRDNIAYNVREMYFILDRFSICTLITLILFHFYLCLYVQLVFVCNVHGLWVLCMCCLYVRVH